MKINDFESEIWYRGKVFRGKQAERFLVAYLLVWIFSALTVGFIIGFIANN